MDVSFTPDRSKAAFVWSDALTAPDVYASSLASDKQPLRLTDLNLEFRELSLGSFKVADWESNDGLPIEGLLYLPPGYREGRPVPLILQVHGGPAGVSTNSWSGERLVFSGLGYAMLCPNVRGSSAYGDALLRGNLNDIGGGDYQDLMSGVDELISDGIVHSDKMGVRGWSYGGILGGWVITQTDRFKAASLGAMVSDWTSEYGQGFNYDVRLWYIGGDPWSNPHGYRKMSPLTHVANRHHAHDSASRRGGYYRYHRAEHEFLQRSLGEGNADSVSALSARATRSARASPPEDSLGRRDRLDA